MFAKDSNEHIVMDVCDMIINVIFTTEMIIRIIWMNFWWNKDAYMQACAVCELVLNPHMSDCRMAGINWISSLSFFPGQH